MPPAPSRSRTSKEPSREPAGIVIRLDGIVVARGTDARGSTRCRRASRDLEQVELPEIELLLDPLERGVTDRPVLAQLDQPPPLRRRREAHDLRVSLVALVVRTASLRAAEPELVAPAE